MDISAYSDRQSSALPGLTRVAVDKLSGGWDDGGLWDDILFLTDQFLDAHDDGDRTRCWHHLVMAVGNFKRQPGRRLRPASPGRDIRHPPVSRPGTLAVPGQARTLEVRADDAATWRALCDELTGAAVATTATLLAALWPERHFVFDRRVFAAVNGLRIAGRQKPTTSIDVSLADHPGLTFEDYEEVRKWVLDASAALLTPVTTIERALYKLAQKVSGDKDRTWQEYAGLVAGKAAKLK